MTFKEIGNTNNCVVAVIPARIRLKGLDVEGLKVNGGNKRGNMEREQNGMEEEEKVHIEGSDYSKDNMSPYPSNKHAKGN